MNVLFLGDSITEANLGVSYVDMVQEANPTWSIVNRGKGGDTVSSLLRRVRKMDDLATYDHIVIFIGVNDVFGKLTKAYKVAKILRRQRWAKNNMSFTKQYNELISHILSYNKEIIVIPPLVLGEDFNNKWNLEIKGLVDIVEDIVIKNKLAYCDIYTAFKTYLKDKTISSYLPIQIMEMLNDVKTLDSNELVDKTSIKRGLHLTVDGVHINSLGASMISDAIISLIKNEDR